MITRSSAIDADRPYIDGFVDLQHAQTGPSAVCRPQTASFHSYTGRFMGAGSCSLYDDTFLICDIYEMDVGRRCVHRYTLVDCQNACIRRQIAATCRCIDNRIATAEEPDLPDNNGKGEGRSRNSHAGSSTPPAGRR